MFLPIITIPFFTIIGFQSFGKIGEYIVGGLIISLVLINWFVTPKYFAKSVLEIYINSHGFVISCVKPFYGSKVSSSIDIKYDEFESYKINTTNNFSTFKITLRNGTKYSFHRWYNDNEDQFDKFITLLEKSIKNHNKNNSLEMIKREKSMLENKLFLISVAFILALMVCVTFFLFFIKGIQNKSGIVFILIFLAPLTWISVQVFFWLRKK